MKNVKKNKNELFDEKLKTKWFYLCGYLSIELSSLRLNDSIGFLFSII